MTAVGLYYIPAGNLGLAGITTEPTEELLALQRLLKQSLPKMLVRLTKTRTLPILLAR